MNKHEKCHCCPPAAPEISESQFRVNRRSFLAGSSAMGAFLGGLSMTSILQGAAAEEVPMPAGRTPLVVKPILVHDLPVRHEGTSWRNWGGVDSPEAAAEEVKRITEELAGIRQNADFPVEFLEVISTTNLGDKLDHPDVVKADLILVYAAGYNFFAAKDIPKDVIVFQRWKSGPVYLGYETISARFLRQHSDFHGVPNIQPDDVVTDSLDELTWRLRSLCGLKNAKNSKVMTIGGASGWCCGEAPGLAENIWGYQFHDISYNELGKLIEAAKNDPAIVAQAAARAEAYLNIPNTTLETKKEFVVNCFVLDRVFRNLLKEAGCRNMTINHCMGTIMGVAKTAACLTLSTLNDDGYLAFCESDFVVIPSGILLANISGKPVFLNDPTYPNDQIVTSAHCTGPRKMDGKTYEPTRVVTHFESDYGAAPKVEFALGTINTNIAPDFAAKRWVGFMGVVDEVPFRPICRTQLDIRYTCPSLMLAERMPGFHWMFGYGDYMKEVGYALRRVGIQWDNLDAVPVAEGARK